MARGILRQWQSDQFLDSSGAYFPLVSIFKPRLLKSWQTGSFSCDSHKEINFWLQHVQGPRAQNFQVIFCQGLWGLELRERYQMLEELPVGAELGSHSSLGHQSSARGNATGPFSVFLHTFWHKYRITAQGLSQQCNQNEVFEEMEIKQLADYGNLVAGGL